MSIAPTPPQHGGHLTIDLNAIVANWRLLGARSAAQCAAVVKADAYGCGIADVVPALAKAGCRTFFVAHLSEGIAARKAAPDARIFVLNGLPTGLLPAYAAHDLMPVLGSIEEVREFVAHAPAGMEAALHIDTGMNRCGIAPAEIADLPAGFRPALILSHLVSAEIAGDPVTARQIAAFTTVRARFAGVPASLANSSGCFLDPVPAFDLLRPGYALYGGNPTPDAPNPMRGVVRLDATILQVRDVPAGASVGYNGVWTAPTPRRIATVSLGYADGYLRSGMASNDRAGGLAVIDGVVCPIAGRISMDLITLDVSDAPAAQRGTLAQFIGPDMPIDTVATRLGTNGYEVLTSLGRRHSRHITGG